MSLFGNALLVSTLFTCASATANAAESDIQTRVGWFNKCPNEPVVAEGGNRSVLIAGLLAAVAPKLIEGAVDIAATALKAAGENKTVVSTAKGGTDFYAVTDRADLVVASSTNCLVVVRGRFDGNPNPSLQWAQKTDSMDGLSSTVFQFEARIVQLPGLKFFRLVPQYLKVDDFQETSFFGKDRRDFSIAVSFTLPGAAAPFGSTEFSFKKITKGTPLIIGKDWQLYDAISLPIQFPSESGDATRAKAKIEGEIAPYLLAIDIIDRAANPKPSPDKAPSVYLQRTVGSDTKKYCAEITTANSKRSKQYQLNDERCTFEIDAARVALDREVAAAEIASDRVTWAQRLCGTVTKATDTEEARCANIKQKTVPMKSYTYFTTQLTLNETREGSKFALYLATALGAAKTDVGNVLKEKLLPKTQSVKDAEDEADRQSRQQVSLAELQVTHDEEALAQVMGDSTSKAADITAARIVLTKSKIAANAAHRKVGSAVPYPELD